jgi:type I restriction-modification system DNA methylase subunit
MDRETYLFHQTPAECAQALVPFVPLVPNDRVIEPFKGEGAFYNAIPNFVSKDWAEKELGKDYTDISGEYDWVITNPPFRLDGATGRTNAFWTLIDYYTQRAKKGIAFLANDACFGTLTPRRHEILRQRGWGITKLVVCSIKKWRGRYFFIILEKKPSFVDYLLPNY